MSTLDGLVSSAHSLVPLTCREMPAALGSNQCAQQHFLLHLPENYSLSIGVIVRDEFAYQNFRKHVGENGIVL